MRKHAYTLQTKIVTTQMFSTRRNCE